MSQNRRLDAIRFCACAIKDATIDIERTYRTGFVAEANAGN